MSRRPQTAVDRAERDVASGDYARARQRLASYLSTRGYDSEVLARLGEISLAMHDPYEAGRYWLASRAQGAEVDKAVNDFFRRAGVAPRQIVAQLPRAVRLRSLDGYPEAARLRIERLGLADAITRGSTQAPAARLSWSDVPRGVVFLLIILAGLACFAVGLVQIGRWLLP